MKYIKNPNDIVDEYVKDHLEIYGEGLLCIFMYGSAVTHEFVPGKSDVNMAIVLKDYSLNNISQAADIQKKWIKKGVAAPFYMTKEYINSSADSYPVEFLDMKENYRILHGEDFLRSLEIDKKDVRLQCERELKGAALHLRRVYMQYSDNKKILLELIQRSMKGLVPIMKGIVSLYNEPIPNSKSEIVGKVEDLMSLGASSLSEVFNIANSVKKIDIKELLDRYCRDIDKMILIVDAKGDE